MVSVIITVSSKHTVIALPSLSGRICAYTIEAPVQLGFMAYKMLSSFREVSARKSPRNLDRGPMLALDTFSVIFRRLKVAQ